MKANDTMKMKLVATAERGKVSDMMSTCMKIYPETQQYNINSQGCQPYTCPPASALSLCH